MRFSRLFMTMMTGVAIVGTAAPLDNLEKIVQWYEKGLLKEDEFQRYKTADLARREEATKEVEVTGAGRTGHDSDVFLVSRSELGELPVKLLQRTFCHRLHISPYFGRLTLTATVLPP